MHKFGIGDCVIVNVKNSDDSVYAHYLDGSYGCVSYVVADGRTYGIEFEDVVDSDPVARAIHGYKLDDLAKRARISENELEPYEFLDKTDSAEFNLIFDG